jgi:heme-degrading monooxygenase HmoA
MDQLLVLNAIVGPAELDTWIADGFREMLGTCEGVPGMRGFSLRRLDAEGARCLYVSVTSFDSRDAFHEWWRSDAFRRAHRDCLQFQEDPDRALTSKRYDIENPEVGLSSNLDSTLQNLLAPDLEMVTASSTFSEVAAWRPSSSPTSSSACVV